MSVWLRRAANAVGASLFLALFGVFIIQISARFGFNRPLPWTDEAAVILYVWVILWATATMVPRREHVAFDLIWNSVGPKGRRFMHISGNLLVGVLALVALPASWDYVRFMAREGTPVLGVPLFWVYLPFVFMLLALVLRCALALRQALRGQDLDAEQRL